MFTKKIARLVAVAMVTAAAFGVSVQWRAASAADGPVQAVAASENRAEMCAGLQPYPDVTVDGKTYRHSPDIEEPELRRIGAMMDVPECGGAAGQALTRYRNAHPDDYKSNYLLARALWIGGDIQAALDLAYTQLAQHPEFTSMRVLQASMLMQQRKYPTAQMALAGAAMESPNDLWLYIHTLRWRANSLPGGEAVDGLLRIAGNTQLPLSAREAATCFAAHAEMANVQQREAAYRLHLSCDARTPRWMTIANLGRFLIEEVGRYGEGRTELQSLLRPAGFTGSRGDVEADARARMLIAESYLLEAAAMDPRPTPRNASLVAQAKASVHGDMSVLQQKIDEDPKLNIILPFLGDSVDVNASMASGRSPLCAALWQLDADAVLRLLEAGARADTLCLTPGEEFYSALWLASGVGAGPDAKPDARQRIIEALLKKGASVSAPAVKGGASVLETCRSSEYCNPDAQRLLEAAAKAKR